MKKRFAMPVNFNDPGDEQETTETPAEPQPAPTESGAEEVPAAAEEAAY